MPTNDGTISFIANHVPPLPDGSYTLQLTHQLQGGDVNQSFGKTYTIEVRGGTRFTLAPDKVYKVFPPVDTLGDYDSLLPHVVLKRRTYPWERKPKDDSTTRSWLALLVFAASEAPSPQVGTVAALSSPPGGTYSYGSVPGGLTLDPWEQPSDACVYVDVPTSDFARLAPSLNDLQWNAHARQRTEGDGTSTDYAVVVANRVPPAGQTAVVHLVSLEGLGDVLPDDNGNGSATLSSCAQVRLASLKSWSFQVGPLQASFKALLAGLNTDREAQGTDDWGEQTWQATPKDSQLRLPNSHQPAAAQGLGAPAAPFDAGYTVLAGPGSANSWYRGPFVPSLLTPPATDDDGWASKLLPAADTAALSIKVGTNPDTDCSYAAAWQLGRLLALADKGFATAQVAWKRDCRMQLNQAIRQAATSPSPSRSADSKKMRSILADPAQIQGYLGKQLSTAKTAQSDGNLPIPQALVDWLGQLALLQSVPFNYLVPDADMLPAESLRFLHVDPRWLACLVDGAWSLEREPARGAAVVWAFDAAYQPWTQLQDGSLHPSFTKWTCWPKSGVLITSRLVSGYWPNICFKTDTSANLLREDRLGPSTLLTLLDQTYQTLTIQEPPEGIHFGFDMDSPNQLKKDSLRDDNGNALPGASLGSIPQRGGGVIQLAQLATNLQAALPGQFSPFTPAEFALELVEGVPGATFTLPG